MGKKTFSVEISEELYDKFYRVVVSKEGTWRGKKEQAYKVIDSTVEVAISKFLNDLEKKGDETGSCST